jgi:hypothetical protein
VLRAEGTLLRGLALDPEGAYVAAAGSDGSLWLWETADGSQAHRGRATAAKVRQGRHVAAAAGGVRCRPHAEWEG